LPALVGLCLTAGCNTLRLAPPPPEKVEKDLAPTLPSKRQFRVSQFVFTSEFELRRDLPLFDELSRLRDQVYKELQLPSANTVVQVYLFEDRDRYEKFMKAKYPDLPRRRAFFVAQPRSVGVSEDLLVYTYWGDRIQQDLRHELTHALLHSVLKDVPLWLDEGLAEFFETLPEWQGVNYQHLDLILRNPAKTFQPDLARLEQLSQVQQMMPSEYREAWAWVHLMLRDKPEAKAVLCNYLQSLRNSPTAGPLAPRLAAVYPQMAEALNQHLARIDSGPRPAPTVQR
jgi:hypothetical protein